MNGLSEIGSVLDFTEKRKQFNAFFAERRGERM
jgi:hypothetical protein